MRKVMEMEEIIEVSNLAIVDARYDGFEIEVNISTGFDDIECACYLYSKKMVVSKSSYKNNNRHIFYAKKGEDSNLRVKVFFRYKHNHDVKKTKFFPVTVERNLRYEFSNKPFDNISSTNCEIINAKPTAIEKYEKIGFQPRSDNIPYKLNLPIEWLQDPFNDRNWMFQLHAWRMLDAYLNRGNSQDLYYASQVMNDWVSFEKNHKSKWLWYDMSTGLRALKICFYLKRCYEVGVDHQIEDLEYLLHEHLRHLSNPEELNPGNHGLFQLHGLKSLTYILTSCGNNAYNMSDMKDYANEEMSKLIVSQLGIHGVHTEDSPDYHFFTHKKITNIVDSPWWSDLSKDILRILELGEHAKPWLVFPNNKCVPIGDSAVGAIRKNLSALDEWPHIQADNYMGARVDGYAVVRSLASIPPESSSFLFFQGSFYSQAHKHCDDLSFILQESGIDLLIDSGKYGYQQDKYRKYFLSTRAHNTIEVDDESTTRSQNYAYGSAIVDQPKCINGVWILKGHVDHEVNEYAHERTIIYKPGLDLYVIDSVTNKKGNTSRKVSQWWHFETDAEVSVSKSEVVVSNAENLYMEISAESTDKSVSYKFYKGYQLKDQLIGWVSKSYLKYEPTSTLQISTSLRKRSTILTRFKLSKNSPDEPMLFLVNNEVVTNCKDLSKYLSGEM